MAHILYLFLIFFFQKSVTLAPPLLTQELPYKGNLKKIFNMSSLPQRSLEGLSPNAHLDSFHQLSGHLNSKIFHLNNIQKDPSPLFFTPQIHAFSFNFSYTQNSNQMEINQAINLLDQALFHLILEGCVTQTPPFLKEGCSTIFMIDPTQIKPSPQPQNIQVSLSFALNDRGVYGTIITFQHENKLFAKYYVAKSSDLISNLHHDENFNPTSFMGIAPLKNYQKGDLERVAKKPEHPLKELAPLPLSCNHL